MIPGLSPEAWALPGFLHRTHRGGPPDAATWWREGAQLYWRAKIKRDGALKGVRSGRLRSTPAGSEDLAVRNLVESSIERADGKSIAKRAANRGRRRSSDPRTPQCQRSRTRVDRAFARQTASFPYIPVDGAIYSHSIVAGGLLEMSYTTRLMPRTSLMMRFETFERRLCGSSAQCAVMKSWVSTARSAITYS